MALISSRVLRRRFYPAAQRKRLSPSAHLPPNSISGFIRWTNLVFFRIGRLAGEFPIEMYAGQTTAAAARR